MEKGDLLHKGAILQRDKETYAVVVRLPGSMIDIATGRKIADVTQKFGAEILKVTGDGRLAIIGIREEEINAVYEELGTKPQSGTALCRQYIKVCPGNTYCNRGRRDTLAFAREIEDRFYPFPKITAKIKIGISGCFNSCSEPAIKDIGFIGLPKG